MMKSDNPENPEETEAAQTLMWTKHVRSKSGTMMITLKNVII